MTRGVWSITEQEVNIESIDDLDRFVDAAEARVDRPTAVSVDVHGYQMDLLVGHDRSFVHLTPEDHDQPYYVTIGGTEDGGVDFWLHAWHHTEFENRHLVPKEIAREAFREFFRSGALSQAVEWEQYSA